MVNVNTLFALPLTRMIVPSTLGLSKSDFIKVILESTEANSNGTAFRLIEETANNLPDVYRSGILTFRVVV